MFTVSVPGNPHKYLNGRTFNIAHNPIMDTKYNIKWDQTLGSLLALTASAKISSYLSILVSHKCKIKILRKKIKNIQEILVRLFAPR